MEIYTDNWFKYLREDVLTEGLRDIGLPEFVVDYLEEAMPSAPEKAKVYIGNSWKGSLGQKAGAFTIPSLQYDIVDKLVRDYGEYVIATKETGGATDPEALEARTVGKWEGGVDGKPVERQAFDDERIKQGEQVKFVIQNLKNTVSRPMGTWRKAFMKAVKALSKAGLPSEKVESTKEYLASFYRTCFHYWVNQITELIPFLNEDPTNYEFVKDEDDIRKANDYAEAFFAGKEEPENIIHTFDDGSYWYNLNVSSCDMEAARMGHCGSDGRGTLVSLRKPISKKSDDRSAKERRIKGMSESFVTMAYNEHERTLYQIKGRNNDAPPEETWDHIVWFIDNMNVQNVEESGEHSSDAETIQYMIEYLSNETSANFHGSVEDRMANADEYCRNVDERFWDNRDELEYAEIGYAIEEDYDGGGNVYVYMSAGYTFDINLGWTGMQDTGKVYRAKDQDFTPIPIEWSAMRAFISEVGIDDMMYEMPGDDGDYEYEVRMLQGAQPEGEPIDSDYPATAHLSITLRTSETAAADEDGEVREYDDFADSMLHFEENDAADAIEDIRQALSAGGYISKTAYDRNREGLESLTDLDKWHVIHKKGGLQFDWTAEDGQPLHFYPQPLPAHAQMYATGTGNVMGAAQPRSIFREIFGYGQSTRYGNFEGINDSVIANVFAAKLATAVNSSLRQTVKGQEEFDFGDQYKAVDPVKFLGDDTDFIVLLVPKYDTPKYPTLQIGWIYRMRVGPQSEEGEFEIIRDIAEYLNEKPELVTHAANETVKFYLEAFMENIEKRRSKVMDNQEIQNAINSIKQTYGPAGDAASPGSSIREVADKIMHLVGWFEDNYNDMNEVERFVMSTHFLIPMVQNNFRSYGNLGAIDNNTGGPAMWPELVDNQANKLGAKTPKARNFGAPLQGTVGEPRPAGEPSHFDAYDDDVRESMEAQIERIEKLLRDQKEVFAEADDSYDLRIYNIQVGCTVDSDIGGSESETQTEIRGIPGITTVRPVAAKKRKVTPTAEYVLYDIKFELLGAKSRVEYRDEVLLPAMRKIRGLRILTVSAMHRTNRKGTIRTVRENNSLSEYGFGGGVAGNLGAQRYTSGRDMPTPRPMLQRLIDDWAEAGVMGYDMPSNTNDMRYHTMFPIEELLPFIEDTEYRGDDRDFEGRYRNFIKTGPTAPVYLAIGKVNKIAKVTGGEEFIFFAQRAGLKELPVFISYQRQV